MAAYTTTVQGLYGEQYHHFLESIASASAGGDTKELSWSKMPASSEISMQAQASQSQLASFQLQSITQDAPMSHFLGAFGEDLEELQFPPNQQVNKSFTVEPVARSDLFKEEEEQEDGDFDLSNIFSSESEANEDTEQRS